MHGLKESGPTVDSSHQCNKVLQKKKKKKFYPNNCYGLIYSVNSPLPQMIGTGSVVENYRKEN